MMSPLAAQPDLNVIIEATGRPEVLQRLECQGSDDPIGRGRGSRYYDALVTSRDELNNIIKTRRPR